MNPDEWARTREIFEAALAHDVDARGAFLDEACAGDARLRAEVGSLFDALDQCGDFIEQPAFEASADLLTDPAPSLEGRVIGPYLVRHEIGRGGMGVVYLADDTRLSRRVALKTLATDVVHDDERRKRLQREARAAASLSHPGIATVYALEDIDDRLYLVSEYVPGPTFRALLETGPLPIAQVIDVGVQLARALAAAHAQGVVHRDLKPENVVRTGAGVVKVLDFGIAQLDSIPLGRLTLAGDTLGTPGYMAPEQIRGHEIDFRADLFSLGVFLYELASGSNPFEATTSAATLARVLDSDPPALSHVCSGVPAHLEWIVTRCLGKQANDRYGSTAELVRELEAVQSEALPPTKTTTADHDSAPLERHPLRSVSQSLWWWRFHQIIVSLVYALMMYPVWRVRSWLPPVWGPAFLLAVLTCAAAATTLRLHLWFTAASYPSELSMEHARRRGWIHGADAGLSALLALAALDISGEHAEVAMLLVTVGVAALIASFVIEPTAARAAFGRSTR